MFTVWCFCGRKPLPVVTFLSAPLVPPGNENMDALLNSSDTELFLPCEENFFRENGSDTCVPECGVWSEYSYVDLVVTDMVILVSAVIGFVSSIAVLVISCIRYKRM